MSEPTVQDGKKGTRLSPRIFMLITGVFGVVVVLVIYGLMVGSGQGSSSQKEIPLLSMNKGDDVYRVLSQIPDSVPSATRKQVFAVQPKPQQELNKDEQSSLTMTDNTDKGNDYLKQLEAKMAQMKLQALQEAMGSSLTLQTATSIPTVSSTPVAAVGNSSLAEKKISNTEYETANMQSDKEQFLNTAGKSGDIYLAQTTTPQKYKYEVKAGTVIPAVLQTGINSDLPGQIIAKIRRNVFDTITGKDVLIPQGATLIGIYSSQVSYGQSRCLMVWNRIIYPDGQNLNLEGMPGADLEGYSGIEDKVNNHYWRVFGNAILMSIFAAGAQVATTGFNNNASNNGSTNTNQASQIMAGALGMQMGQAGMSMIQKNMNIQPTLEIRPGNEFNVLVTRDVAFKKPYKYKL